MPKTPPLILAARRLRRDVDRLSFGGPITHVYNPLSYARAAHERYLERFGAGPKRVVFVGMNPGPWGMTQTGVPFGEVAHVRDWLGIEAPIGKPEPEHPKRLVQGLACPRSEVSGKRLWGLFKDTFGKPEAFFAEHFVANYCPLVFMEESARNFTPDKLPADERAPLEAACDTHLQAVVKALEPEFIVGVGGFATKRTKAVLNGHPATITTVLHPSPASPRANRGWAEQAKAQLIEAGVWPAQ